MFDYFLKLFSPEKYWIREKNKRFEQILSTILEIVGSGEPYIIGGRWSWMRSSTIESPQVLDLVLPELGTLVTSNGEVTTFAVVVMVWPPFLGTQDSVGSKCSKATWERCNQISSLLRTRCETFELGLLEIGFYDPIDKDTLALKLKEMTRAD